jgi:hypothetical protein
MRAKSLIFQCKHEDHKHREAQKVQSHGRRTQTNLHHPDSRPGRCPQEEAAGTHRITPTTLIQALIIRKFKSREGGDRETDILAEAAVAAKLETLRNSFEGLERGEAARFDQLRFEIVKTRSALLHSLDQTLSASVVDQIIEASDHTAREYTAGLAPGPESKS